MIDPNELSTKKDFLVYNREQDLGEPRDAARSESEEHAFYTEVLGVFPDADGYERLFESIRPALDACEGFVALAVHPDDLPSNEDVEAEKSDRYAAVAKSLQRYCDQENAKWGIAEDALFALFLLDAATEREGEAAAKHIQAALAECGNTSATVGIASHPMLDYPVDQVFQNAKKAVAHAKFFGPGSVVCFDAVSLNISGDECYQNKDIAGAVSEYKKALEIDPNNINVRNSLGVCYGVEGDYEKALHEFQEIVRLAPEEVMAIYNAGLIHLYRDEKNEAMACFLAAADKDGNIFEVAFQIGKLLFESGDPVAAKAQLTHACSIRPNSSSAQSLLGECCKALGEIDAAVAAYKRAIRANPNDALSLSALGWLMSEQDESLEVAEVFCRQSIEIAPENGLYHYRLGRLYDKLGRLTEALEELRIAEKANFDVGSIANTIEQALTEPKRMKHGKVGR